MDHATYRTRREAQAAASRMRGWRSVKVERLYLPDAEPTGRGGNAWVIHTEGGYLRQDGFVR